MIVLGTCTDSSLKTPSFWFFFSLFTLFSFPLSFYLYSFYLFVFFVSLFVNSFNPNFVSGSHFTFHGSSYQKKEKQVVSAPRKSSFVLSPFRNGITRTSLLYTPLAHTFLFFCQQRKGFYVKERLRAQSDIRNP